MKKLATELSEEIIEYLQGKAIVFLQAVDPANQSIYSTALSWIYATSSTTIHFAIDSKSKLIEIFEQQPQATLNFIGCESAFAISGKAKLIQRKAKGVSINLAIVKVEVEEVRDILFFGGKVVKNPEFIKTYNPKLVEKLDREVYQSITQLTESSSE